MCLGLDIVPSIRAWGGGQLNWGLGRCSLYHLSKSRNLNDITCIGTHWSNRIQSNWWVFLASRRNMSPQTIPAAPGITHSRKQPSNTSKYLDGLHQRSLKWKVKFNASKSNRIYFRNNNSTLSHKFECEVLQETSHKRDLGVTMQPNLDFEKPIEIVSGKVKKILGMIAISYGNK